MAQAMITRLIETISLCSVLHRGARREIRLIVFPGGASPARDFLVGLLTRSSTSQKGVDLIQALVHLSDNERHSKYKPWTGIKGATDLRQLSKAEYRIIMVEEHSGERRTLSVLCGFEKHERTTPRRAVAKIQGLYTRYESGRTR